MLRSDAGTVGAVKGFDYMLLCVGGRGVKVVHGDGARSHRVLLPTMRCTHRQTSG